LTVTGYICEIFSSYQGEGGSIPGSLMGRRQVFVRFAGCNLARPERGTGGCRFCDSPGAKSMSVEIARLEVSPGGREFESAKNPVSIDLVMGRIAVLRTRDLHSVSLTGGEPLGQPDFLDSILGAARDIDLMTYLETNGSLPGNLSLLGNLPDFACVDIKDRSAGATSDWGQLLEKELDCIEILKNSGVVVFSKMVVTEDTDPGDVEMVSERLSSLGCSLAIQPVTPIGGVAPPGIDRLGDITRAAAKHLLPGEISLSVQMHKKLGMM